VIAHLASLNKDGPNRTFVRTAANVFFEPTPDLFILCCERSQRGNCCGNVSFYAAAQRRKRPFMRAAAETTRSRIKSRTKLTTVPPK
jgi:hypothetical protein